jgi:hypothetical protein
MHFAVQIVFLPLAYMLWTEMRAAKKEKKQT